MRKILVTLAALAAATAFVAACGDDNGGDGDAVEADDEASGPADVTLQLEDFQFSPDSLEGTAGETLTLELDNTGDASHTFTGEGVDEVLQPGDTATVAVDVPDTGEFEFFCRFHRSQGMTGAIVVSGTAPGGGGGEEPAPAPETSGGGGSPGY